MVLTLGFRGKDQEVVVSPLAMLEEGQAIALGRFEGQVISSS